MSVFSGKCDLYDCEVMIYGENNPEYWKGLRLYVGNPGKEVPINRPEDLVPYYPFIESIVTGRKCEDGTVERNVWIGEKSYITTQNEEMLEIYKKHLLTIYNRCKRKKIPYDVEAAWKEVDSWNPREDILELARRVGKDGKKASIQGLHWSTIVAYDQKQWKRALIEAGYEKEWVDKWIAEH